MKIDNEIMDYWYEDARKEYLENHPPYDSTELILYVQSSILDKIKSLKEWQRDNLVRLRTIQYREGAD